MTIKTLFQMVEQANAFNELMGDKKQNYISLRTENMFNLSDDNGNKRFYTFKEFKKVVKSEFIKEFETKILTAEYEQDEQCKNYFYFEDLEIGIFEN